MSLAELFAEVERIAGIIRASREKAEPRMNILDIAGVSELELKNSAILAFLLDPRAGHKSPRFGELFLDRIKERLPGSLQGSSIRWVRREEPTRGGRYIDLFLETDRGEHIIIENKVGAADSLDQLKDYIAWAEERDGTLPLALYLTPSGASPAEASLCPERREVLRQAGHFLCLSYERDILAWLGELARESDEKGQALLASALLQYRDAVEGFCGMRKEDSMEHGEILAELLGRLKLDDESGAALVDLQETAQGFSAAVDHLAIIQFLLELRRHLKAQQEPAVFTLGQKRYVDQAEWIEASKQSPHDLGLEIAGEREGDPEFGIGLEFSEATRNASIYFGLMAHRELKSPAPAPSQMPLERLNNIGSVCMKPEGWWWYYAKPGAWFSEALFCHGKGKTWRNKNASLALHVARDWFGQAR